MTKHRNIFAWVMSVAAVLSLSLLASCTMVVFEGDPVETFDGIEKLTKNRMSKISFAIYWPDSVAEEEVPDYLTVVMNRIQNTTVHYVYYLDSDGNILESFDVPEIPENPEIPEGPENPEGGEPGNGTGEGDGIGENEGEGGEGTEGEGGTDDNEGTDGEEPGLGEPETGEGTDGGESGEPEQQAEGDESGTEGDGNGDNDGTEGEDPGAGEDGTDGENPGEGEDPGAGDNDGTDGENPGEGEVPGTGEGQDDTEGEVPGTEDEDDEEWLNDPSVVHNGYYSIAAIAVTDHRDFIVPAIQEFEDSLEFKMRDVYVTVPQLTKEERREKNLIDFNPVYPYIRNTGPFYYVRPSNDSHIMVATGSDNVITLKPQLLTRRINLRCSLECEDGVVVERFAGTISGVPQRVQLMTGNVSDKDTGKIPFEFSLIEGSDYTASVHLTVPADTTIVVTGNKYNGQVNAFGLFPSENPSLMVGPGILTVTVQASVLENGVLHSRRRDYNISLKNEIEKADIMMQTEDKSAYRFTDTENADENGKPINIREYDVIYEKAITITKEWVINGVEQGFENWQDNDNSGDGLNPEV